MKKKELNKSEMINMIYSMINERMNAYDSVLLNKLTELSKNDSVLLKSLIVGLKKNENLDQLLKRGKKRGKSIDVDLPIKSPRKIMEDKKVSQLKSFENCDTVIYVGESNKHFTKSNIYDYLASELKDNLIGKIHVKSDDTGKENWHYFSNFKCLKKKTVEKTVKYVPSEKVNKLNSQILIILNLVYSEKLTINNIDYEKTKLFKNLKKLSVENTSLFLIFLGKIKTLKNMMEICEVYPSNEIENVLNELYITYHL